MRRTSAFLLDSSLFNVRALAVASPEMVRSSMGVQGYSSRSLLSWIQFLDLIPDGKVIKVTVMA